MAEPALKQSVTVKVEWAKGVRLSGKGKPDAPTAFERIESLRVKNEGRVTPDLLIEDAAPEDSTLHPFFEWDDSAAANEHRKNQARQLMHSFRVVIDNGGMERPVPKRIYVRVVKGSSSFYTTAAAAMSEAESRAFVLQRAINDLRSWKERYSDLQEMAQIHRYVEECLEQFAA